MSEALLETLQAVYVLPYDTSATCSVCGVVAKASMKRCTAVESAPQRLSDMLGGWQKRESPVDMVGAVSVRYSFIELERSTTRQMSRSRRTTVAAWTGWKSKTLKTRPKKIGTLPEGASRVRRPKTRTALIGSAPGVKAQAPPACWLDLPKTTSASSSSSGFYPSLLLSWRQLSGLGS